MLETIPNNHGYFGPWYEQHTSCNLLQHIKTATSIQDSGWCHALQVERSAGSNQT